MAKRANGTWRVFLDAAACTITDECIEGGGRARPTVNLDGGRQMKASRYVWTVAHGDPGNLFVLHTCDNALCLNVRHMYLGDQARNMQDMDERGRRASPQATARIGEANGRAQLSEEDIREIRRRHGPPSGRGRARGRGPNSQAALAAEFGVVQSMISRIVRNERWSHM